MILFVPGDAVGPTAWTCTARADETQPVDPIRATSHRARHRRRARHTSDPPAFIMSIVSVQGGAPEPLHMEQQRFDFPGKLDATQLEGCWFNLCGCCQGYRPTGPDSYVTTCNLMWGFIVCPDPDQVFTREPGTNNFRGPTIAFVLDRQTIYGTHYFKSKSIATSSSIFAASSNSPAKGCEWMCCYGLACKVPCSIPACITKGSMPPWLKKCCEVCCSGDGPMITAV